MRKTGYPVHVAHVLASWVVCALVFMPSVGDAQDVPRDDAAILRQGWIDISKEFIDDLAKAEPGSRVVLPLFDDLTVVATAERMEPVAGGFNWFGQTETDGIGDVIISVANGVLVGSILLDTEIYRIHTIAPDIYVASQINAALVNRGSHPAQSDFEENFSVRGESNPPALQAVKDKSSAALTRVHDKLKRFDLTKGVAADRVITLLPDDGSRIDLMIVYTQAAVDWVAARGLDLEAEIQNMVWKANVALIISGVTPYLNLVHHGLVDYEVMDYRLQDDLDALVSRQIDNIADLRDQYRADLVNLVVFNDLEDPDPGDELTPSCGRANALRSVAMPGDDPLPNSGKGLFSAKGYSVSTVECIVNGYTLVHELAHNMGAHHDNYTVDKDEAEAMANMESFTFPIFDFSRGFILLPLEVRTIMAYKQFCVDVARLDDCARIPRFSNPNKTYMGFALGISPGVPFFNPADNVQTMNLTAWTVANFRNSNHVVP